MTERREAIKDARAERREDEWYMRDPTHSEFLLSALGTQDDVSWYNIRDAAVRQGYSNFEADYESMCAKFGYTTPGAAIKGEGPLRIHNLGDPNQWGYPAGIPCTYGLVFSGYLFQEQIKALNNCVPLNTVLAAGEAVKQTLKAVGEKLKPEP